MIYYSSLVVCIHSYVFILSTVVWDISYGKTHFKHYKRNTYTHTPDFIHFHSIISFFSNYVTNNFSGISLWLCYFKCLSLNPMTNNGIKRYPKNINVYKAANFLYFCYPVKNTHRISAQHNGEENTYGIGICWSILFGKKGNFLVLISDVVSYNIWIRERAILNTEKYIIIINNLWWKKLRSRISLENEKSIWSPFEWQILS